jgi:vacuolar-type H+-ATPase subunit I/STV1
MSDDNEFPVGAAQAAFDAVSAGEVPENVEPTKQGRPVEEVAEAVVAEANPFEGVPSALLDRLAQLEAQLASVNKLTSSINELKSNIGRIDSIQSALAEVKSQAPPKEPAKREKWDHVQREYDDIAAGIDERLDERLESITALSPTVDVSKIREELAQEMSQRLEATAREARELAKIEKKYPDWEDMVADNGFQSWLPTQAPGIQALVNSEHAADAIRLLDLYTEANKPAGKPTESAAKRLERAVAPSGNSSPIKKVQQTAQEAFNEALASGGMA